MSTITLMTDRHQAPSYPLRMPPDLKDQIAACAKKSGRSLHAEIVQRLQHNSDLIDQLALMAAAHAYDQSVNTALMREKGELQAQLAKKDAEIQVLRQRLFLGNADASPGEGKTFDIGDLPAMLLRLEAQMAGQREALEALAAIGVNARLYPDGKLASVKVGGSSERGVSVQLEHPIGKKMREEGRLPSQQRKNKL